MDTLLPPSVLSSTVFKSILFHFSLPPFLPYTISFSFVTPTPSQ